MSLEKGYSWTHKDIRLVGYSVAGISTSVCFPAASVCLDVAQGLPFQIPMNHILLTHGHMDHAGGLPYLIGQKAMMGMGKAQIFMPESLVEPLSQIMKIWEKIEGHEFKYEFQTIAAGESRPLKDKYFFRSFPTFHRIPSQGYTVFLSKKMLKAEYQNCTHQELSDLRRQGTKIDQVVEIPQVSFTGDTRSEVLNLEEIRDSRVLVIETTYWDSKKSIDHAREWGHLHLDELLPRLDELRNEKIVLIHSSARYSKRELDQILDDRVPDRHRGRIEAFPRP